MYLCSVCNRRTTDAVDDDDDDDDGTTDRHIAPAACRIPAGRTRGRKPHRLLQHRNASTRWRSVVVMNPLATRRPHGRRA